MRILITGGCGFIGSHLADYHLKKNHEVQVIDNLTTGSLNNIAAIQNNPHFKFYKDDLLTWDKLDDLIDWSDRIYHLAAVVGIFKVITDPVTVLKTTLIGTQRILDSLSKNKSNKTLIITSSSSVYGDNPKHLLKEDDNLIVKPHNHPLSPYAVSKLTVESMALAYYTSKNIQVILPRLFNVIGPHQTGLYGMVVPRFIHQAYKRIPFTVYGNGEQTRSFCDVRDCISMLDLLASTPAAIGQIVNVGNDDETSINHLAKMISNIANCELKIEYISYEEAYGSDFIDTIQRRPDISKMFDLIHFKHKWPLEKTLKDLYLKIKEESR